MHFYFNRRFQRMPYFLPLAALHAKTAAYIFALKVLIILVGSTSLPMRRISKRVFS
jgi:hypothetical protein